MDRLMAVAAELPEAERVDIEAWGGEPTFRVRGKNFVALVAPKTLARTVLDADGG